MTYKETLKYLFSRLPMYQRAGDTAYKAGLETSLALDTYFGNPHRNYATIHIAGTNGKGSVAHMLASVLQTAGYKTGLYTSPHLSDYRERIRINGNPIPTHEVTRFVEQHREKIDALQPSFFEMSVALAFDYFARMKVDIAVVETGMGGRLDSTNIIRPLISAITNISYDHTAFLGNSIQAIAAEKAGIIKAKTPVVIGQTQPETKPVFDEYAEEKQAPVYYADARYNIPYATTNMKQQQVVRIEGDEDLKEIALDLAGAYQKMNLPLVLQVIALLQEYGMPIAFRHVSEGLAHVIPNTGMKGRWQYLGYNPRIIADVGHNAAGLKLNMKLLQDIPHKQLHIVFGTVNDKNPKEILGFLPDYARYYFTQALVPRAFPANELVRHAREMGLQGEIFTRVPEALKAAQKNASANDLIFVGGSTFVVAEVV